MKQDQNTNGTITGVTVFAPRGETVRVRERKNRRAKTLAAIEAVEKIRFLKKLEGQDCSAKLMTLADLEQKHIDAAKPKKITVWNLLIWTYCTEKTTECLRRENFIPSGGGLDSFERMERLGVKVEGGSSGIMPVAIHPDARTVDYALLDLDLPDDDWRLVMRTARLASVPKWWVDVPEARCEPVLKCNGKPKMLLDRSDNIIGCKVVCSGVTPAERYELNLQMRKSYEAWITSLRHLEVALSTSGLKRHLVRGLGVRACPWSIESISKMAPA